MDILGKFFDNYKDIYDNIINGGISYLKAYPNVKTLILGISGGIDSALTAALAKTIADKIGIELLGYSLPTISNESNEIERAKDVGKVLCNYFEEMDITSIIPILQRAVDPSLFLEKKDKIRTGNLKARMRMMFLYDKAAKHSGIVLSTDNYTEYLLGFWTLHGDVGDFGLIQKLWKTEVYGLTEWMACNGMWDEVLSVCLEAKPTDGLGVSNSDLDQLLPGWKDTYRKGYQQIDEILQAWLKAKNSMDIGVAETQKMLYDHPVIGRHLRTEFKRCNPFNLSRIDLIKEA